MKRKTWAKIHEWTGLASIVFLLMLFLTGLPLIFREEIEHLSGEVEAPELKGEHPEADLDQILNAARERRPDDLVRFVFWDPENHPDLTLVSMAPTMKSPKEDSQAVVIDSRTARVLDEPVRNTGFMYVMHRLHADMFAGMPGTLILGFMGILTFVSIVSGAVLYHPFMSRVAFGTFRTGKAKRIFWLDLHNIIGVTGMVWILMIGLTGTVNSLERFLFGAWKKEQLQVLNVKYAEIAPYTDDEMGSVSRALTIARNKEPEMWAGLIAFPGTPFSTPHHFTVFMKGKEAPGDRMLHPVLVDAKSGEITPVPRVPWYMTTLFIARPLHFGDYGGLPLKILWAILDLGGIALLWSGLYAWYLKYRSRKSNFKQSIETHDEIVRIGERAS